VDNLVEQYNKFSNEFQNSNSNLQVCQQMMESMKLQVATLPYPPTNVSTDEMKRRLVLGRNILENGALLSLKRRDVPSFERFSTQLKIYYFDYGKRYSLPHSALQYQILGLNLLRLLAQSKLDEFHTEVELIPSDKQNDIFVRQPLQLEQYMMEGAYNKVLQARTEVPSESYNIFMDQLMGTVRNAIAECIEKSYDHLRISDASKLLALSNQDLQNLATERKWKTIQINNENFFNFKVETQQTNQLPTHKRIIKDALQYAKELERIV